MFGIAYFGSSWFAGQGFDVLSVPGVCTSSAESRSVTAYEIELGCAVASMTATSVVVREV